jgi:hypothetical protein
LREPGYAEAAPEIAGSQLIVPKGGALPHIDAPERFNLPRLTSVAVTFWRALTFVVLSGW